MINGGTYSARATDAALITTNVINDGTFVYDAASAPIENMNIVRPSTFIEINGGIFNGTTYQPNMYEDLIIER